jgi:hypothetical protein
MGYSRAVIYISNRKIGSRESVHIYGVPIHRPKVWLMRVTRIPKAGFILTTCQ